MALLDWGLIRRGAKKRLNRGNLEQSMPVSGSCISTDV
jgi:hypothetical protein